jgi:pimeloyl-ACP methyl ester carboxylesterase
VSDKELFPTESRVLANGLTHRVLAWGPEDGVPLVCTHGFLDHAWSFHLLAQPLARAGLRVLAFDWRGHGETDRVGAGGYYHFADYVLDLRELVPQIARAPFHVLAHSMGGAACAMWASTRPEGLASLVLCEGLGPPAAPLDSTGERLSAWVASVARVRAGAPRPMADLDEAARRMRTQHAELDAELARFLAEKGTRPFPLEDGRSGLTWCFDPLHRTPSPMPFRPESFGSICARIAVPTLVVTGARGFRTEDHAERVAAIPGARELELPDVGHMMHWHAPDALARAVLDHLKPA